VLRIGLLPDVIATMCLFCKIVAREIKADIVFEDPHVLAFKESLGRVLVGARTVAQKLGLVTDGYRVVLNSGRDAGQSVFHLHAHVLGGRPMAWPPG
jgi:histidine triad (HIT) family protein